MRIVRAPDGTVALDATGRAAGRGAYLCRDAACREVAARRRSLEHALGVPIPADVLIQADEQAKPANTTRGGLPAGVPPPSESAYNEGGRSGQE